MDDPAPRRFHLPGFPKIRKVSTRVRISFAAIVLFQGLLSMLTLSYVTTQAMEASLADQRQKTRLLIERYFADAKKEVAVKADLLAGQAKIGALVRSGEQPDLSRELYFYLAPLSLDCILVVDAAGEPLATVGNSAAAGILLRRNLFDITRNGGVSTIAGEGNRIQLWGLHEIRSGDRVRGMVCAAVNLDRPFIGRVEEISSTVMLLALRKTILVNGRVSDNVFIDYSRKVAENPQQGALGRIKSWEYRTIALPDYPELETVYFIDTAPGYALLSRYMTSTLAILALALLLAVWMSLVLYRYSFLRPFQAFQEAIRNTSKGDLSFRPSMQTDDEFAELEREFEGMTNNLRSLERELQIRSRMAAIGEMVAGVAHQLRNPLAVMKVSAEMIRDGLPPSPARPAPGGQVQGEGAPGGTAERPRLDADKLRPLVEMIVSEVDSLTAVMASFLDFTRPLQAVKEETDLAALLERVASHFSAERSGGVSLGHRVEPPGLRARLDPRLMEQALRNLVSNAVEASAPGSEVTLTADGHEGRVRFRVADQGKGMTEEVRKQLFHPFFTTKSYGTGLGLSITRRIIEEHGGRIEVASEAGGGTEVALWLDKE
jgi:signal transduction histidine kinase